MLSANGNCEELMYYSADEVWDKLITLKHFSDIVQV